MPIRITIRFSDGEKNLHDAITKSAQNNRRSLNAELLRALEFYLKNVPEAQCETKPAEEVKKKPSLK